MTTVLLIFLGLIVIIGILIFLIALATHRRGEDLDSQYFDENGDHVYYDRSAIEKREFAKHHPDVKDVRTFRRLFRRGVRER